MDFKKINLFEKLTNVHLERLSEISIEKVYKKGNILFFQGAAPESLLVLVDGVLKIYKSDAKGNEFLLKFFYPFALIAELSNLENIPYHATAQFETDGKVLAIDYKIFEAEFLKDPDISFSIIRSLSKKLRALDRVITQNLTMDSTSRIATFIYENEKLFLEVKQSKIAAILNITPETMSRVIKKFKKQGIVENIGGDFKVLDRGKLKGYIDYPAHLHSLF